jgi:hypothetical protein
VRLASRKFATESLNSCLFLDVRLFEGLFDSVINGTVAIIAIEPLPPFRVCLANVVRLASRKFATESLNSCLFLDGLATFRLFEVYFDFVINGTVAIIALEPLPPFRVCLANVVRLDSRKFATESLNSCLFLDRIIAPFELLLFTPARPLVRDSDGIDR